MVGAAEQVALPQAELVAGQELAAAGGAAEALQVVDVVSGAHHQVAAAEGRPALGALDAEEPAGTGCAVRARGRTVGATPGDGQQPRVGFSFGGNSGSFKGLLCFFGFGFGCFFFFF